MRRLVFFLGAMALVCVGCARQYRDTTLYQISGRQKPIVAVLPVINHVEDCDLNWDLSREFTDEIRNRIYDSKRVYLLRDGISFEVAKDLTIPNPQMIPSSVLSNLGAAQFAIIAEVIEQKEKPYGVAKTQPEDAHSEVGSVLSMALRVRVVDVRKEAPRIILQEVIDQDFVISRAYMKSDYNKTPWGTEAYSRTPLGMAHARLVRELVARAEAYIEAAL